MPNTNKEFFQAELDRLINEVSNFNVKQPDTSPITGYTVATLSDKNNHLQNLRNEAAYAASQVKAIDAANVLSSNGVQTGQYPFITGVKTNYVYSVGRSFTSEWNTPYSQTWNENLLALISGISKTPSSNYVTTFPDAQTEFENAPVYEFNTNSFKYEPFNIESELYAGWADGSYQSYSPKSFIIFALRNNNLSTNKNVTINFNFSSYTTYSGANLNILTPNNTNSNRSSINGYTFTNVYNYTSATHNTNSGNITVTIPADKTIIVIMHASDYYWTSYGSIYMYRRTLFMNNPRQMFTDTDITPDYQLMENIRRGRSGDSVFNTLPELWTVTPPTNRLSQVNSNVDVANIMDKTLPTYADNSAAVTAGLGIGRLYKSSTGEVRIVV